MIRQSPGPDDQYDPRETELVLQELASGPDVEYPAEKELVLRGRAAIARREYNPDDTVPTEVDDMLRAGIPRKTLEVYEYQWGRFIHWCGVTGREPAAIVAGAKSADTCGAGGFACSEVVAA